MAKRPYDLPPLSALASFEAAARHVSFKEASRELNVTPAAVSHQVKALEAELGQLLFHRKQRGVVLTEAGALLFVSLQRGFEEMADGVQRLKRAAHDAPVVIQATSAVSSLWLTSRLARFWKDHPDIQVTQHVMDKVEASDGVDLLINYGEMPANSQNCFPLFGDRIIALASPAVAEKYSVRNLEDFENVPLIHLNDNLLNWTSWQEWAERLGYQGSYRRGTFVDNYIVALHAAQDDIGFILGWEKLTRQLRKTGALVQVLEVSIEAPHIYYIETRNSSSEKVSKLRDWLLAEAKASPDFN
ncbi:LysR family transcriptional regulator [Kiloniella sp. b19]|uniref:LysR family transcriptional regulator n=1 Tax=Kiloniella sp. GXU_MW_B19 TaxID=3141326 RepID=UPI0031D0DBC8